MIILGKNATVTDVFLQSTTTANYGTGTTKNMVTVTSVNPYTHFQTTIAAGITGNKHLYTKPANSSKLSIIIYARMVGRVSILLHVRVFS